MNLGIVRTWEPGLHRRRVLREGKGNSRSSGGNLERLNLAVWFPSEHFSNPRVYCGLNCIPKKDVEVLTPVAVNVIILLR